jgi:hypothetical protein
MRPPLLQAPPSHTALFEYRPEHTALWPPHHNWDVVVKVGGSPHLSVVHGLCSLVEEGTRERWQSCRNPWRLNVHNGELVLVYQ